MRLRFIGQRYSRSIILTGCIIPTFLCLSSICSAQLGTWERKADMPTPRNHLGTAVVDGKIYAIGGYNGVIANTQGFDVGVVVEEYDPARDTWTRKADMPILARGFGTAVVDGKIYTIDDTGVQEYNPATDTWVRKTDMPTRRDMLYASMVDGKIYAIGGYSWAHERAVEEYDPATDTWSKKADMPTPRQNLCTSVVDGKIYAIGGNNLSGSLKTVEEYDPAMDTWTKKTDMPTARTMFGIAVVNKKIYVIGGSAIPLYEGELSSVEIYDPATDIWTQGTDMPTANMAMYASVLDGRIYVFGGYTQSSRYFSTVEVYDTGLGMKVTDISPQGGPVAGGGSIAISGSDFLPEAEVSIGGNPLIQLQVTDSLITGIIPEGTEGEQDIRITVSDFNYSSIIGRYTYKLPTSVVVTRITPTKGKLAGGDMGSIAGSGFVPGASVTIGGNPATNVAVTPTLISFTIPPGTEGAKDVVVTNPDGRKDTLRGGYTYNPFPVIKSIRPGHGGPLSGGTQMTITGSNFMEGVIVTIGEKRVQQLDFFSPTELRLRTPPGTVGPKSVRVTNPDGQEAVKEDGFSYNLPPRIFSLSPNAGPLEGGTPITITGTGFIVSPYPPVSVLIGDAEASIGRVLPTQITAVTPISDAGVKDVVVVNPDGQRATLRGAFTYNTAPVITRVTPDNGRLAGGTRITIQGGGFQPGAEVRISINQGAYRAASSVEVMSSSIITALTPPGQPGAENVLVLNPDMQIVIQPEGFTYNAMPVITRLIPNHGPSSGGATITVEGTGFLLGARVVIGQRPATTMVRDDMTIEAVAPPNPQGVWDVRVVNPDTQEVVMPGGFVSVGEVAYNYPNPFRASQGTTFRYVTRDPVLAVTVKIFNMRGRPIGAARQTGSNEVKWCDPSVHAGLYVYILEVELEGGKRKQARNVMEVVE